MKRLRNRGFVRLIKFVEQNAWYDYARDEQVDEGWFFYTATFVVAITDEGRGWWDSPTKPIGFKQSAYSKEQDTLFAYLDARKKQERERKKAAKPSRRSAFQWARIEERYERMENRQKATPRAERG